MKYHIYILTPHLGTTPLYIFQTEYIFNVIKNIFYI
jgi:hypothetical protein